MSIDFGGVTERLKLALKIDSEQALAGELGMSQSAWSNRKTRGSVPTKAIDVLIARYGLNPQYVYDGEGKTHQLSSEPVWRAHFAAKLAVILRSTKASAVLLRNGYTPDDLAAVLEGQEPTRVELLRDLHDIVGVDLHGLLCDEAGPSAEEQRLLALFRLADPGVRQAVVAALAVGSAPAPVVYSAAASNASQALLAAEAAPAKPVRIRRGGMSVEIHGDVGQRIEGGSHPGATFSVEMGKAKGPAKK